MVLCSVLEKTCVSPGKLKVAPASRHTYIHTHTHTHVNAHCCRLCMIFRWIASSSWAPICPQVLALGLARTRQGREKGGPSQHVVDDGYFPDKLGHSHDDSRNSAVGSIASGQWRLWIHPQGQVWQPPRCGQEGVPRGLWHQACDSDHTRAVHRAGSR